MENSLFLFLVSAATISLSGVLSPGPMTAAVIEQGTRSRFAGAQVSIGHGVIEMPLIGLIFLGAGSFLQNDWIRFSTGILGGIYLLYLAKNLLFKSSETTDKGERISSPLKAGILLSIGNPYFLLWWGTVGVGLVLSAVNFGIKGLILFAIVHWLCDLIWYSLLSSFSFKGVKTFGKSFYRKVSLVSGLVMVLFGGIFIYNSLRLFT